MKIFTNSKVENSNHKLNNVTVQKKKSNTFQFVDNRPETAIQRQVQEIANTFSETFPPIQQKANNTGLPNQLKSGIENLSGYSMDDVKVHYNSPKPAQLQAHAYAQGTDIHIASGQEKHLPHEAWHVVQQKQGRVKPTTQLKGTVNINDDAGLEKEADVMGGKAMQINKKNWNIGFTRNHKTNQLKNGNLAQLIRVAPAITGAAAITTPRADAVNRDTVTPGPTHVGSYGITMGAAAANRNVALGDIRGEYRSIGNGFNQRFLSEPPVWNLSGANIPFAARIYDIWVLAGVAAPHALGGAATPQNKQTQIRVQRPIFNVAANLELLRNNINIPYIDPVEVNIQAPYGIGAAVLEARVDFTEGQKGYISRIQDVGGIDASISDRANYAGEHPVPNHHSTPISTVMGRLTTNGIHDFSNVHHTATIEDVGTQIARVGAGRDTRLHVEGGLDAMTKVIAEGGRFHCVEALGMAIRNDSLFFAQMPIPYAIGHRTVEFRELWKMWTRRFGGRYGVTDAEIATVLTSNPIIANVNHVPVPPAVTGYNYDLTTSAIH